MLVQAGMLPSPRSEASVFSDGRSVYVAGGLDHRNVGLAEIVRFDPTTDTVTALPETLPWPNYAAAVAWTGSAAYIFGGLDSRTVVDHIVRYSPGKNEPRLMSSRLPLAVYNAAAVWTGKAIYIFGGVNGGHLAHIFEYDPASDTITRLPATLPIGVEAPGVFWDGKVVWILGGKIDEVGTSGAPTDAIQTFEPSTKQARWVGHLPYPVWDSASFGDGKVFHLVGGNSWPGEGYDSIVRFDPSGQGTYVVPIVLPLRMAGHVGTWVSSVSAGYVCGAGDVRRERPSAMILRVVP